MGNNNHGSLLKKATTAGLACLLLVAGLPLPEEAEESYKDFGQRVFTKHETRNTSHGLFPACFGRRVVRNAG